MHLNISHKASIINYSYVCRRLINELQANAFCRVSILHSTDDINLDIKVIIGHNIWTLYVLENNLIAKGITFSTAELRSNYCDLFNIMVLIAKQHSNRILMLLVLASMNIRRALTIWDVY